jgi:acyl-CoA thioesterase-2
MTDMTERERGDLRAERARQLARMVSVTPDGDDRFRADTPDWFGGRVFGGVIVAQALNAAIQTVGGGLPAHSLHGYFLRTVRAGDPVELRVERVRDGRSFTTREVSMLQDDRLVFRAACSFHADEPGDEYQLPMSPAPPPGEVETVPMPGPFEVRDAGPTPVAPDGTYQSTGRLWFRFAQPLAHDPGLHTSLAGFLSDLTRASFRPYSLNSWGEHADASLDHAVWFHRPLRVDEWLFYDLQAVINTGGRSLVRGSMYTEDGKLCLSMAQELLIRPLVRPSP